MMPSISMAKDNRLLLALGLGLSVGVLGLMRYMLISYRDAALVKEKPQKTQYINQETEDALKVSTLTKLYKSHSHAIKDMATRIACDRALHDNSTLDAVLHEATCPELERRERGVRALYYLFAQDAAGNHNSPELESPKVYKAIVKILIFSMNDLPYPLYDKEWDDFDFRGAPERICILLLTHLVSEWGTNRLLDTHFVDQWLAKQNWGTTDKERQSNFAHLYNNRSRTMLGDLVRRILQRETGLRQIMAVKLISDDLDIFDDLEVRIEAMRALDMFEENLTLVGNEIDRLVAGRRREPGDDEGQRIRRQHRQAMVLNDGAHPLTMSDIIGGS